jgi:peptidoglycan/LPS O-acetylase OafA/YrhL
MIAGFAAIVGMGVVAGFVVANYVEWENSQDALRTVAVMTAPPALGGSLVMLIGRWVYGEWRERAPIMGASSLAVRIAGFVVAIGLGALLTFLLFTGMSEDDQSVVAVLGLGAAIGVALIFLGFRIKPRSNRRYLD